MKHERRRITLAAAVIRHPTSGKVANAGRFHFNRVFDTADKGSNPNFNGSTKVIMKRFSIMLLLGLTAISQCGAGSMFHASCPGCGCGQLKKVCRIVPDVKKVTETKYTVECEDVCLPGKSRCEERVVSDSACVGSARTEKVQVPTCDRVVTKKKLKKTTTTVEKPGWKCVVDTVCCQCGGDCSPANCGK